MATWLVTGGAGFIGGNFVLEAVARGVRVVNLDALTYAGNLDTLASLDGNPDHVFVHGDIGDRALIASLLAEHRPDAVLNFAAESHVDRSIDGPAAFIQTNVVGTLALLEAARSGSAGRTAGALSVNRRQWQALVRAAEHLEALAGGLQEGMPGDCLAVDLRQAITALGEVTGEDVTEQVLDRRDAEQIASFARQDRIE